LTDIDELPLPPPLFAITLSPLTVAIDDSH
jgi:hypothetical protein